jgi:LPXTG-motif cell wall-anchored protein
MKKTISSALLIGALSISSVPAFADTTYPAPAVTPNTVNGTPPASSQTTPAPMVDTQLPSTLPNTGPNDLMFVWGGVGVVALLAGAASVIYVRRKADA